MEEKTCLTLIACYPKITFSPGIGLISPLVSSPSQPSQLPLSIQSTIIIIIVKSRQQHESHKEEEGKMMMCGDER